MIRVAILALLVSCAPDSETLVVFAASSLTEAFEELEREYERTHDVDVRLVFGGSQVLRLQIEQGADADVIATAHETHLRALAAELVADAEPFATNELVVIVPTDSRLRTFDEIGDAARVVLGTETVPVGIYAREVLGNTDDALARSIRSHVVSEESNVRLIRAKVEMGEADAAFVYRSDVTERVRAIEIPEAVNTRATYSVGALSDRGRAWVDLVRSEAGQTILRRHGFAP